MRIRKVLISIVLMTVLAFVSASADGRSSAASPLAAGVTCGLAESNADALEIMNNYYPNSYWWDHADLTVAVQAHPHATEDQVTAIRAAIATWKAALDDCFDGLITLADITDAGPNAHHNADIVIHFVPNGLGFSIGNRALCVNGGCPSVFVRSDFPPGHYEPPYGHFNPQELGWVTMHELGHALGLGHATNLWESDDLMGYGWYYRWPMHPPILSDCDMDALAFVFAWAIEGGDPYPPAAGPYDCSLD
jgi:hypothetical protein